MDELVLGNLNALCVFDHISLVFVVIFGFAAELNGPERIVALEYGGEILVGLVFIGVEEGVFEGGKTLNLGYGTGISRGVCVVNEVCILLQGVVFEACEKRKAFLDNKNSNLGGIVNDGVAFPPSLQNIFKEIQSDLNIPVPTSGNLTRWANQGVLLLNATLTVRAHQAGSHQRKGWEEFYLL